ncbi:MAG TPA: tetratricopeptide repeat-containing protein kinase family protein, partial [Polyangiaceae bacterium]|nr:tetratricopeptide repeat-containing protein kinase family protein [Polyangiaceae bacterium]
EPATTTTDVWALGVILHELLSGVRPYRGSHKSIGEIERAILEAAPSRPSTHAGDRSLRRRLRGDLDAIVLKALRSRPEDRYPSAEALASDVRRHLEGLPVTARGETATYLLRSFVRRYRLAVGASALGLAVVLAGLAGTLWQAHRARQEARKAEQVQDFLLGLLQSFDPSENHGRPVEERDILIRGEERLQTELADRPEVQARLWRAFGRTWQNLGVFDRAKRDAERAIALERSSLGPRSEEEGMTLVLLGDVLGVERTHPEDAAKAYRDACAILRERRGNDDLEAASACAGVGGILRLQGDFAHAERISAEHLALLERVEGERAPETLAAAINHALVLGEWGRIDEAIDETRRSIPVMADVLGAKDEDTDLARYNLAYYLVDVGRADEAEPVLRGIESDLAELLGPGSGQLASVWRQRARALVALGRPTEALDLLDRAAARSTEMFGEQSQEVALTVEYRAAALRGAGRLEEAESSARRAVDMNLSFFGDNQRTAKARSLLGSVLLDEGRVEEARTELSRALAVQERILLPTHPYLVTTRTELARAEASAEGAGR